MNNQKNECKHNFFPILNDTQHRDVNSAYVTIGCAWCGQIRKIHMDGLVEVKVHKGNIKYEV